MSSGGRFDLSALQVTASVLAAVTGAVAASYLGIAGTIIGTAVMSVAGTAGSAFYRFYLGRGQETLRTKAAELAPRAMDGSLATALSRHRPAAHESRSGDDHSPADATISGPQARSAAGPRTRPGGVPGEPAETFPPFTGHEPAGPGYDAGGYGTSRDGRSGYDTGAPANGAAGTPAPAAEEAGPHGAYGPGAPGAGRGGARRP